jgi:ABC-type glycerol-3-phosphate transport system permease component
MSSHTQEGSLTVQRRIERALGMATLIALSCLFVMPFLILVGDSLKTFSEVWQQPRSWIPKTPQWYNYIYIFESVPFHRFLFNTVCITALALVGQVSSACVVAYSFARLRWPLRDFCFIVLLSTIMLPQQVIQIPVYLLFNWLGWLDTWLPLIVPFYFGGGVFNIFLMRQFFKTIPVDLEDAAKIDGCSALRTFVQIFIPLSKPAVVTVSVLSFMAIWNDFMGPLVYLSDFRKFPVSLGINMFKDATSSQPNLIMAATLVAIVPVVILFFSAQKYFVEGIVLTGTKG